MRGLAALIALLPGSAWASGYYYSDSGIVATGRGGAWVAGADTQFAQNINPAGLIRIEHPTLNLGWSGVQQNVRWQQAKAEGGFFPEQQNAAPPFSVPQIGFAMPVGDKAAFAFGFISPFAPSGEWNRNGPQRYNIIDSSVYQFGVGPSVALQPIEAFTFGFGAQWSYLQVGRSLALTALGTGPTGLGGENDPGGPDPGGDVFVDANATDLFTPTFNLGVLIEPDEMISIGASITPPASYSAVGTLDVDFAGFTFEDMFEQLEYTSDATLQLKLPTVIRAGVAIRPVERLEIEAAWVWQQWSTLPEIVIDGVAFDLQFEPDSLLDSMVQNGDISNEVTGPFSLPAGLVDASSYRLGVEYRFTDGFEARVGGFFEEAAIPPDLVTISLVDTPKVQVGAGASGWVLDGRLRADVAAAILAFQSLNITNSSVKQVNADVFPECGPGDTPSILGDGACIDLANAGNGKGNSNGWIIGLQLQYAFKKGA